MYILVVTQTRKNTRKFRDPINTVKKKDEKSPHPAIFSLSFILFLYTKQPKLTTTTDLSLSYIPQSYFPREMYYSIKKKLNSIFFFNKYTNDSYFNLKNKLFLMITELIEIFLRLINQKIIFYKRKINIFCIKFFQFYYFTLFLFEILYFYYDLM